jgi:2-iminobutanoate/2-iminopropanoate deaminase
VRYEDNKQARKEKNSMSRQYIAKDPTLPFADAVLIANKTLYISGRIGLIPGTRQVPDDLDTEATNLMQDLQGVLAAADLTLDDLVSLTIYCPDVSLWEPFNAIYRTFFTGPLPPRAFIGSGPLLFGARFELQGIAVKP